MQVHLIYTQRDAGGFDHAVALGDTAPWRALEENVVNCASAIDAERLKKKIDDMQTLLSMNVECSVYERDVIPAICGAFVTGDVGCPDPAGCVREGCNQNRDGSMCNV